MTNESKTGFDVGEVVVIYATVKNAEVIDEMVFSISGEREVFGLDIHAISRGDLAKKQIIKKYKEYKENISTILDDLEHDAIKLLTTNDQSV